MFNFVCRSKPLILHYGRRTCTITPSTTSYFYRCKSTTTSTEHPFTVSYLISSCGFSPKSALLTSKHVYFDSPEKPNTVIAWFKSHGFSEKQILKVIKGHPQVLWTRPEKTLLPKLEFFHSKGFSSEEFAKFSTADPVILLRSLEKHIIPSFNRLSDLFKTAETAIAVVKCNPLIFRFDAKRIVAPSVNVLRHIGVPQHNIALFFRHWRRPSETSFNILKNTVNEIKKMGFNPLKSQFIQAVVAKLYGRTGWERRVNVYRRWGWSEEEFLAAFRMYPLCMVASEDKITAVMDFLVNKMEIESSAIAKHSYVIGFSIEKRFIPRADVFQFLLSNGLLTRENTFLIRLFTLPEKDFLQRFVNFYDEAPELLKLYQENSAVSKMRKTSVSRERDGVIVK